MNSLGVCLMGIGIVFAGLLCIVGLCYLMSYLVGLTDKKKATENTNQPVVVNNAAEVIPNREEMVAAVSAVIAEDLGKDVSAIKIVSFKKI